MALPDLTNQNIQDTYQRVVQTDGTKLYDGTGSLLPVEIDGNNIIVSGTISATEYIVTSSVTNVIFQQQSGSTIFGDSTDDTHLFTGSLIISGGFSLNPGVAGPNNVGLETGNYNVGYDFLEANFKVTGSGIIVSGSTDSNHHPMVKIGNVELLDVNTVLNPNTFLIHNVKDFLITSASDGGDVVGTNDKDLIFSYKQFDDRIKLGALTGSIGRSNKGQLQFGASTGTYIGSMTNGLLDFVVGLDNMISLDGNANKVYINFGGVDMDFVVRTNNFNDTLFVKGETDNIGIGTSFPSEKLSVHGNITVSGSGKGNIFASGSISAKNNVSASIIAISSGSAGGYIDGMYFLSSPIVGFVVGNTDVNTLYRASDKHQYLSGRVVIGGTDFNNGSNLAVNDNLYVETHITASGTISASNVNSHHYFGGRIHTPRVDTPDQTSQVFFGTGINVNSAIQLSTSGNITASGNLSGSGKLTYGTPGVATIHELYGKLKVIGSDVTIGDGHISMSGHISGGLASTASFAHIITQGQTIEFRDGATKLGALKMTATGDMTIEDATTGKSKLKISDLGVTDASSEVRIQNGHITASGDISSSADVLATAYRVQGQRAILVNSSDVITIAGDSSSPGVQFGKHDGTIRSYNFDGNITASGDISSSGTIIASNFQGSGTTTGLEVDGYISGSELRIQGNITASGDISASGNIYGEDFYVSGHKTLDYHPSSDSILLGESSQPLNIQSPTTFNLAVTSSIISASGTIFANKIETDQLLSHVGDANTGLEFSSDTVKIEANDIVIGHFSTNRVELNKPVTASGNISSSGTGSFTGGIEALGPVNVRKFTSTGFTTLGDGNDIITIKPGPALHVDGSSPTAISASGAIFTDSHITASGNIRTTGSIISNNGSFIAGGTTSDVELLQYISASQHLSIGNTGQVDSFSIGKPTNNASIYLDGHVTSSGNIVNFAGGTTGSEGRAGTQGWANETGSYSLISIPPTEFNTHDTHNVRYYGLWARGVGASYLRTPEGSMSYVATYVIPKGYKAVGGAVYGLGGTYYAFHAHVYDMTDGVTIKSSTAVHSATAAFSSSQQLIADADSWTHANAEPGSYVTILWDPNLTDDSLSGATIVLQTI